MAAAYKTFLRSARNFEEFSAARKITVDKGLTQEEARRACMEYNSSRTSAQISKGTKMEYTAE